MTCAWIFNLETITNSDSKDFDEQFSLPGPFCNNFCDILHVKRLLIYYCNHLLITGLL